MSLRTSVIFIGDDKHCLLIKLGVSDKLLLCMVAMQVLTVKLHSGGV